MERGHWLKRIQSAATFAMHVFDPLHVLDVQHPRTELNVWELAMLRSIWHQPTLWPAWHPDTQKLQQRGLVASEAGTLVLTPAGLLAMNKADTRADRSATV
ncbi:conserved hypothetical protein [Ricinus communis]|uniref:Uncharacterized protein n=1 Tax=Ricinus communis TaxID=3988 RepID=B9TP84_RICCO|nr:conserved hypothetical protein [Ricinus communis]